MKQICAIVPRVLLSAFLLLSSYTVSWGSDDPYYLESEIHDTEVKYNAVHAGAEKARNFIAKYGEMKDSLSKAYDELTALEDKMRDILQKNLIKSTIKLGIDTYGKVTLVLGFAEQSAKLIIVSCACEFIGDQMQDSFSTPYNKAVKGLSEEARKLAPEMNEVQKTLAMSMDEVKAEALKGGDKLGDVGAIYRKFSMVLEAIDKAKKELYEIRKNLDKTDGDVKDSLPRTEEEEKALDEKLKGLRERLAKVVNEKIGQANSSIAEGANSIATVQVKPVNVPVKDEVERQAIIAEKNSELITVGTEARAELDQLNQEMDKAAQVPMYDGRTYNPLQYRIVGYPIFKPVTEKDLKDADPVYLKQQKEADQTQIDINKNLIPIIQDHLKGYSQLEESIKGKAAPIMGVIVGLGGVPSDWGVKYVLKDVAATIVSFPMLVKTLQEEIEILDKNKPLYEAEFNRQVSECMSFAKDFETESAGVVNAASAVAAKADAVNKAAQAAGLSDASGYNKLRNTVKAEVAKMLADGQPTSEVRAYLDKQKAPLIALYEEASKVSHLVRLRDNSRNVFENKYMSDPRLARALVYVEKFPETGVKDPSRKYMNEYSQYQTGKNMDAVLAAESVASNAFSLGDQINDFMQYLDKIDDINKRVRELYSSKEYMAAARDQQAVIAELNTNREFLNGWLQSFGSTDGKTPGMYKILSKETQGVIAQAQKRYQEKEDAENKAREDEAKKKDAEELKKKEDENWRNTGYSLFNPRLNTVGLGGASGDVVVLTEDLNQGALEVTARLNHVHNVQALLISMDDGRIWAQLPITEAVSYSFSPMPDTPYRPVLKIKTNDGQDILIPFFPQVDRIIYRNIDYTQLITETVKKIAEAYETKNIPLFSDCISRDFLGNKTFLEEGVRFDFDLFDDPRLSIFINRIERRAGIYTAETKWDKTQTVRKTGQEQRTSGNTVMIFTLEDGKMKITNLRGNLIYATLSPEIAQASGLSQTVVDQVRVAHDARNPVQPGAGQTESSGGVTSFAVLQVRNSGSFNSPNFPGIDFSFASGGTVPSGTGDVTFEDTQIFPTALRAALEKVNGTSFDSLDTAPSGVYGAVGMPMAVGNVYVVLTAQGYFAKMEITSLIDGGGPGPYTVSFRYAVQTDGTRNLATQ